MSSQKNKRWFSPQALFIACGICVGVGGSLGGPSIINEILPSKVLEYPKIVSASELPGIYSSPGEVRLLYRDFVDVYGTNYVPRNQGSAPSCVGQATAGALDFLAAVEVKAGQLPRPPPSRASASWVYGSSREIGGMNQRLSGGSFVSYAVESISELGFVYEEDFWLLGIDLVGDNAKRDVQFGNELPDAIRPFSYTFVEEFYKVTTYEQVRDAICNGMPVIVGSNVGFGNPVCKRDHQGFLNQPYLKIKGRNWYHAMFFIGVADNGRKGVLCQNSWGEDWVTGSKRFGDEPAGSFWIDAALITKMASQGDCYAIKKLTRLD
jgi:hypothetical protein